MEKVLFNKIVQAYSDTIFRIAFQYCRNRADAEDIVQNVFIKFFGKKKSGKARNISVIGLSEWELMKVKRFS